EVVARLLDFFKKRGITEVAMLNDTGAFGASARDQLRAQAPAAGINVVYEEFGPAAFLGDRMKRSVELFVEEANKKGGLGGRRIELTLYDAGSESTQAVLAAKRLIEQDTVEAIVGDGNRSDIGLALVPSVQRAEVPLMSVSGATALVEPVKDRAWVFKSTVNDVEVVARLLDFFKKRGIKDVAMLNDTGAFGASARDQLRAQAPVAGVNVVYEEFGPGDNDLTTQLTRIRGSNAKAIICWTVTPAGVVFLKNAQQLGLKQLLVHGFGFVADRYMQLAGDAAEGLMLTSLKFPVAEQLPDTDPIKATILDYKTRYRARYSEETDVYGGQAWDGIGMVAQAITRAGGSDRGKIRAGLEEHVREYKGVGGVFTFSPQKHWGLAKSDVVMIEWRQGKFRLVDL
ncbi:MAG TPA: ABC transporter substrate-binding protein, partial [Candidatus Eisenbacteria bacterium]|nr:ABC transporter substrate-binding protein [Candidatus Eisenbacteria bacterium]